MTSLQTGLPHASLPETLKTRAALEPEATAYIFLDEDGAESTRISIGELHIRAVAVAEVLSSCCTPGDRALLVFPSGPDFVAAFLGCLYSGVVAVPVSPPRRNRVQDATCRIARDCTPAAVLTTSAMQGVALEALDPCCGGAQWLAVDGVAPVSDTGAFPIRASHDAIAMLQYTSGSTSDPKGVMVSHGNLVANQLMIQQAFGHDEHSTVVGWAPFFHDQGLIGNVLQPLYVGATSILMSPMAFVRRPLLWLSVVSRYRAHTSGGPNFAFDACVAHAARGAIPDLDLSSWRVAFNGAEPILPTTLTCFAETFAPYGFRARALYPCYGLAEATLLVTGSRKDRGRRVVEADVDELSRGRLCTNGTGRTRTLAGSGSALRPGDVRIVDPRSGTPCPPDRVGEIWVAGDNVALGYWQQPAATAHTFQAEIAGERGRQYLRTGDLGVISDDELYVVGRLKDILIIRGRNHYPHDIEHTARSAHPALRAGVSAAFTVPGPDGERLVVVQEIARESRHDADARVVAAAIRAAIVREHAVSLGDLVLTVPGRLQKTTSGKIMRGAARKRYLDGGFEIWESGSTRTGGAAGGTGSQEACQS